MIQFDEETHSYTKDNKEYISVTTLIKQYTPQFDPTGDITARCAAKKGITPREMAEQWEAKAKESADYGTNIHKVADLLLKDEPFRLEFEHEPKTIMLISEICEELKKEYLSSETIIWDEDLLIAGTIDLLTQDDKGNLTIWDWKTNQKPIEIDNKYNTYLLEPLQSVPANDYYKYAMQLSLYKYLLEKQGKNVSGLKLIHLYEGFKEISLPYLKFEVEQLIKHYKENTIANLKKP